MYVFKNCCIVTDYRLNANHNQKNQTKLVFFIVTDYRLNANHNLLP
ncbi:Helicase loader DnaI [uncultured Gammaproteobacteria bacterium]|nr:Helicase loader DnaI [uncultured Gammaproteobacteria bacterium]